ncbi:MAG: flagellar hook-basal body protein [Tepidisphaeraceae bacterium]|jgi:flagellar basal-body rod protein FlgG
MIYGLYASAAGVRASSHRLDVVTNNLANSETTGFKRDLAIFQERHTAAAGEGLNAKTQSNPDLEALGGGMLVGQTSVDLSQGELESTGNPMDFALQGKGFFAIREGQGTALTRDGRFITNRDGYLVTATTGRWVLDQNRQPILLKKGVPVTVAGDGTISQGKEVMGKVGVFDVPDQRQITKHGDGLFGYPDLDKRMKAGDGAIVNGAMERSNADAMKELASLMDASRNLEANANLIRYQDQTLSLLVNVGKIS